jgi:hypothetical protein
MRLSFSSQSKLVTLVSAAVWLRMRPMASRSFCCPPRARFARLSLPDRRRRFAALRSGGDGRDAADRSGTFSQELKRCSERGCAREAEHSIDYTSHVRSQPEHGCVGIGQVAPHTPTLVRLRVRAPLAAQQSRHARLSVLGSGVAIRRCPSPKSQGNKCHTPTAVRSTPITISVGVPPETALMR